MLFSRRNWPSLLFFLISISVSAQVEPLTPVNFKSYRYFAVMEAPVDMQAADFNKDGQTDLVVLNESYASILLNDAGTFNQIKNYRHASFHAPFDVETGDHDGDGLIDVFIAFNSDSIAVLTNLGSGTFAFTHKYRTGTKPGDLKAADLNKDGRTDLVVVNGFAKKVLVFINSAQGFLAPVMYNSGYGSAVDSGDFDNDGYPDLAITNVDNDNFSVLLNNHDGTFQAPIIVASGQPAPAYLIAADFNKDALDDIIVSYYLVDPSVYKNTASGFQLQPSTIATGTGNGRGNVCAGDLDLDGYPDVVTVDWDHNLLRIYRNNKDGSFGSEVSYPTGVQPHHVLVKDFNSDGKNDVAVLALSSVEIFFNKGDGTFPAREKFGPGYPYAIAAADFNNDHLDDVAAVNLHGNAISVSVNTGKGVFTTQKVYPVGKYPTRIVAHDLNGDSRLDLLVTNSEDNTLSVLKGAGDGTFLPAETYPVGKYPLSISVTDVNNDNLPDIVTGNGSDQTVSVLLQAVGGFNPAVQVSSTFKIAQLEAADFSNDGLADLVIAVPYPTNGLYYRLNTGNLTFSPEVQLLSGAVSDYKIIDMTGDGLNDIVVTKGESVYIFLNKGDGSFAPAKMYPQGYDCHNISIGDFNSDGRRDIATSAYGNGGVYVLLANASNGFADRLTFARPEAPLDMVAGNFDGNEKTDLVIGGWPNNALSIMLSLPVLKVTASDTSRFYGYSNPEFKSEVVGLQGADQVSIAYTTPANLTSVPGSYEIKPVPDAFANTNYAVLAMPGTLTVKKAPLKVTVFDTTRMFSLPNPVFRGRVEGVRNNDYVYASYSTTATSQSPVGEYPIRANVSFPTERYTVDKVVEGVLTITVYVSTEPGSRQVLNIYPNPATAWLIVELPDGVTTMAYVLQDHTGKTVSQGTLSHADNSVVLNTASGIYIMKFDNGEVRRLVVK